MSNPVIRPIIRPAIRPAIRIAELHDLSAIIDLLANDPLGQARETMSQPPDQRYIDAFEAIENDDNQLLAIVEQHGQIVGCMQISFVPGLSRTGMWRAQIESVRIAASQRGEGTGRMMIEWAIAKARQRNCGLVQLTTDKSRPAALKFYQNLGFSASHEGMKLNL